MNIKQKQEVGARRFLKDGVAPCSVRALALAAFAAPRHSQKAHERLPKNPNPAHRQRV